MSNNRTTQLDNVQVQREVTHTSKGQTTTSYFIGWGDDGRLQGDELTYKELTALHSLIGRIIEQDKPKHE